MLVQERARRSTAGNRMRDLLEQEFEAEEMFVEAENDVEFEEREGMSMPCLTLCRRARLCRLGL